MRYEQLIEFKLDITVKKYGPQLQDAMKKHDTLAWDRGWGNQTRIMDTMMLMDPTNGKNNMYTVWLIRQYIAGKYRFEDSGRVSDALSAYHHLKPRLPVEQRDIGKLSIHDVEKIVDNVMGGDTDDSMQLDIPGADVIYSGPLGTLVSPNTEQAACLLSRGTKWCTGATRDNRFHQYNSNGPLYIWKDKTGKYQFHFESGQFMDAREQPISREQLIKFKTAHPIISKIFVAYEEKILASEDLGRAIVYARGVLGERWPKLEEIILSRDRYPLIYWYARDVIKGRWPEAEPSIKKDPEVLRDYTRMVKFGAEI